MVNLSHSVDVGATTEARQSGAVFGMWVLPELGLSSV